ncbi:unnamed protein product [Soboliphyme baturini]|uniref:BOS complex subunit TMEM147 n=1 Tax=Soboliphyme baturini TaxID=241478 RepID=A0A183ID53_9BILA|nr:unnamed protein product [Soboliphyme baturini]
MQYFITLLRSEYSTYWKCAQAGCIYFEFMKSSVDVIDLLGLYIIITRNWSGKGEVRFLAAGLGWAAADAVATRTVPFWVGARGVGFDWKYIQMGFESNINLVFFMAIIFVFS